jgi:hypothetical protein
MIWQNYELENTVLKSREAVALWKTGKGFVEIGENTLAVPFRLDDQRRGFVFHGKCRLLLDTIVETEQGAIGKSVEEEVTNPFLMLGAAEGTQRHLIKASKEDLAKAGYENEQDLTANAKDVCRRFFGRARVGCQECWDKTDDFIFAFQNKADKLDILAAKGSKLVYKSTGKIYVSDSHKTILKTPDEVVLVNSKKPLIIETTC